MSFDADTLYNLLPAIYRIRDAEQGEPLKALMAILAEQSLILEEDLAQLYDNQFIETCADWVIPYIGDLIGYREIYGVVPRIDITRAEVANTIRFRRRKGTASVLEQLARDVTGWDARVVEYFQLLVTNQYMNHVRPQNLTTVDMRDWQALERLNSFFETTAHTIDVRQISTGRGRYNIPNIGIFLWRLKAYPVQKATAHPVDDNGYTFDPLGFDIPLFNQPQPEGNITQLAKPINVAEPLSRRRLYEELENMRQEPVPDLEDQVQYFSDQSLYFSPNPVLQVFLDGEEVPANRIRICNLSTWRRPAPEESIRVAVDPMLGRLIEAEGNLAATVEVSYSYGFSDEVGSGPYRRSLSPFISETTDPIEVNDADSLLEALDSINPQNEQVLIQLQGSPTLQSSFNIALNPGQTVYIRAESNERPVIDSEIIIESAPDVVLIVEGLLITQGIRVNGSNSITLLVRHCTIPPWLPDGNQAPQRPEQASIEWRDEGSTGSLTCDRSITGRLRLGPGIEVSLTDSIVDALADDAIALAEDDVDNNNPRVAGKVHQIARTTIIGRCFVEEIQLIENSIITGNVLAERKQQGCVRFSYLPLASQVPRRYRCQPTPASEALSIQPQFTSLQYSNPAYGQLSQRCPLEIRQGADDESEMGTFHDLYQLRKETNLRVRLDEYLRFGLEAGFFYVT